MKSENLKKNAMKAGGVLLVLSGLGVGMWIALVMATVLTFAWFYSMIGNVMESWSVSEYLGKIVAVVFAAAIASCAGMVFVQIIKRNKQWIPIVAGFMVAWFVLMYFISSPYTSGPFNPFSGQARATYLRTPDGMIKIFPKGLKFDPDSGKALKELDPATAEEYQIQQGGRPESSFFIWQQKQQPIRASSKSYEDNLVVWVENIVIEPKQTVLHMACQGKNGEAATLRPITPFSNYSWNGYLYAFSVKDTYLVDKSGQAYNPTGSSAVYEEMVTSGWGPWEKLDTITRSIRIDEVYRFTLTFPSLPQGSTQLRLHLANLEPPLELDFLFSKAVRSAGPPGPANAVPAR